MRILLLYLQYLAEGVREASYHTQLPHRHHYHHLLHQHPSHSLLHLVMLP